MHQTRSGTTSRGIPLAWLFAVANLVGAESDGVTPWRQDVRLLLCRWLAPVPARAFVPVQVATGGLVLACALVRRRRTGDDRDALTYAYGLTSMWLVLFGPCTQTATYLLAGPAVALLLVDAARRGVGPATWAVLGPATVFAGPLQTTVLGHAPWHWGQDARVGVIGLCVLIACASRDP